MGLDRAIRHEQQGSVYDDPEHGLWVILTFTFMLAMMPFDSKKVKLFHDGGKDSIGTDYGRKA